MVINSNYYALISIQEGIRAIQRRLLRNKGYGSVNETGDMHPVFEITLKKSLPPILFPRHEQKYKLPGIERRKADYTIEGKDGARTFIELVFSDQEPKSSFLSNMRKAKGAKDVAVLTHPSLRGFQRYWLFAIRWDISRKLGTQEKQSNSRSSCLSACHSNPNLKLTDIDNLPHTKYVERGFFFGDNFCFDFSLRYVESLVMDTKGYGSVRRS